MRRMGLRKKRERTEEEKAVTTITSPRSLSSPQLSAATHFTVTNNLTPSQAARKLADQADRAYLTEQKRKSQKVAHSRQASPTKAADKGDGETEDKGKRAKFVQCAGSARRLDQTSRAMTPVCSQAQEDTETGTPMRSRRSTGRS